MLDHYIHIGEMLARNGRIYPEEPALVERIPAENKRRAISWKEFDRGANRLANLLLARGVRKGDKVVHLMMNSIDWLIAYFGIIRTGAWVVPLNFRFTSSEIKYCLDVAEPRLVLFGEEFSERLDEIRDEVPVRDYLFSGKAAPAFAEPFPALMKRSPDTPPEIPLSPDDPCALYFTSGTTGRPKPILLTHRNLVCAAVTENVHHGQVKEDTFVLIPPLYHTGAKMHWFGSLIVGGSAVILKGVSPEWIFEAVNAEGGTILWLLVPWVQDILLKLDRGEMRIEDYRLDQLRLLHIGAMPVPPSLVKRWQEYFPHMDYDTTYGLSEASGPNCVHLGIENTHKVGAIGRAGFKWETRIVDDQGMDVEPGEVGELAVRGGGLMREYYKNPEATAAALKQGWLHTGDLARQDEEGFIYLVDRKKDLIICGGENVFPVEVENFVYTYPGVKDAAAIGYPDERLGEIVAIVIETVPGVALSVQEILSFCEMLPRYKRPRMVFFGEIPRNPTGKIQKTLLRKQYIGEDPL
jgi:acyl-CoA synthetase (AMP-forming)/AMP-acid ligase II